MTAPIIFKKLNGSLNKNAENNNVVMPIFLEINIGNEEAKFGFQPREIFDAILAISTSESPLLFDHFIILQSSFQ